MAVVLVVGTGYVIYTNDETKSDVGKKEENLFPGWVVVRGKQVNYEARFPLEPAFQTQETPLEEANGKIVQELHGAREESGDTYVLNVLIYPVPPKDDPHALLASARDEMLGAAQGAQLISSETGTTTDGNPSLTFVMQSENSFARGKFIIAGNALYDIHLVHDVKRYDAQAYEYFTDSLLVR